MSRGLSTDNQTAVDGGHVHQVLLGKFEFDTPVYVHTGVGTITYDGNDYLGVGDFAGVSSVEESEDLSPALARFVLSGFDSTFLSEALDSGNYGDVITIYEGYRKDDGTLEDDPWIIWKGTFEYSEFVRGQQNAIAVIGKHDLAVLDEADGSRFTDEDQRNRFSGDLGLSHVHEAATKLSDLLWGGKKVVPNSTGGQRHPGRRHRNRA